VSARSAIILFAHGARDPKWASPFQRIQSLVSESFPDIPVELAFLERMTPDLPTVIARVMRAGVQRVTVIPLFLGVGGHVKEDLTGMIEELERKYPALQFHVTSPIGEDDDLVAAIAGWVVRQHR
jgi:sirohydrochlorin cobaltochelatase